MIAEDAVDDAETVAVKIDGKILFQVARQEFDAQACAHRCHGAVNSTATVTTTGAGVGRPYTKEWPQ